MDGTTIKEWTKGKLHYRTFYGQDEYPDISYLEQDYSTDKSITKKEAAKYRAQDQKRLDAYNRGDWYMGFVGCEISATTPTNWACPPLVGRAYLHGIESDSGEYINQVAEELVLEAEQDARNLQQTLKGAI